MNERSMYFFCSFTALHAYMHTHAEIEDRILFTIKLFGVGVERDLSRILVYYSIHSRDIRKCGQFDPIEGHTCTRQIVW